MDPALWTRQRRAPEPPARLAALVVPARPLAAADVLRAVTFTPATFAWVPRADGADSLAAPPTAPSAAPPTAPSAAPLTAPPAAPATAPSSWSLVGWGAAAVVDGAGDDRLAEVRARAERLFDRIDGVHALPFAPRLFGGFAFAPADDRRSALHSAWSSFGDASFALPRVLYASAGDRAFIAAFVPEADAPDTARTLDDLRRALDAAPSSVDAVHPSLDHIHSSADAVHPSLAAVHPTIDSIRPGIIDESGDRAYTDLVARALDLIERRALAKVVLCRARRLDLSRELDIARAFALLDARHPECTRFLVRRAAALFLGATPERLVSVCGRRVVTEALAGSTPRRHDAADADAAARADLLASEKERTEHAIVVAAIRAALASACEAISVPDAPRVRSLSHVHHLATPIAGTLRARTHVLDLAHRLHPTPALCGAPTDAARAFILANEPAPRGWYGGAVGWFDARGDGSLAVSIRSALIAGTSAWIYAGAGIVRGSDPARELAEIGVKERTMREALEASA